MLKNPRDVVLSPAERKLAREFCLSEDEAKRLVAHAKDSAGRCGSFRKAAGTKVEVKAPPSRRSWGEDTVRPHAPARARRFD